jgi:phosphatidyl-myo-inositol dimannoside synthase
VRPGYIFVPNRKSHALRTLLISDNFPPRTGGSGRWFWEIYRRLPRDSFMIAAGEHQRQAEFDRAHDVRVVRLPLTMRAWGLVSIEGLRGYTRAVWRLRRLLAAERIGMVHCGRCLPEGVMALALKLLTGVPYACYVHGEDVGTARASREHVVLVRRVFGAASLVIANSRNTERILREEWGLGSDRVRLLYPGVDTERFVPAAADESVRRRLGWAGRTVVLTVGRLQLRKGHDQMILALRKTRETMPDVLYSIVGDGEERAVLEEMVRREGLRSHVQFLGELDDDRLLECYQQCDLFVLPNRQVHGDIEGFGMVLLEAQACGKPVVAGASGGTAETMRIPQTGLVVPCEGPDELAAAVLELLSEPRRRARMGKAARDWVVEQFDWSQLAQRASLIFQGQPSRPALETVTA